MLQPRNLLNNRDKLITNPGCWILGKHYKFRIEGICSINFAHHPGYNLPHVERDVKKAAYFAGCEKFVSPVKCPVFP